MKLIFNHFSTNGFSGMASASIPGEAPASQLDRASYFAIQAGFYLLSSQTVSQLPSQITMPVPGTKFLVHVNFIIEQENPGSDSSLSNAWPEQNAYRVAFARMLANMLAYCVVELPAN
jgi:hypothetical protein